MSGYRSAPKMVRGSRGFVTIGATVAVLAGSLAFAFGAPQHSKLLSLLTGHGWVTTSSPGQVMLANGQTGQLDFRLDVGTTGDPLDVVQSGQNTVLVDQKTGQAGTIDLGNLKIVNQQHVGGASGSVGTAAVTTTATQLLPGPKGTFYIVHRRSGRIDVYNPVSDQTVTTKEVGSGLSSAVTSGGGSLWVEREQTGALVGVDYQHGSLQVQEERNSVVAPGNDVRLSSVNGTPAVLDQSRGLFFLAPDGVPGTAVSLPRTAAPQMVVAPTLSGPVVPLAAPGKVVLIQNASANVVDLNGRAGNQLGAPVPFGQKIYVPDISDGAVVVLNDNGQQVGTPIQMAHGSAPLSVNVQNGALFINDPDSNAAVSVNATGQVSSIVKNNPNVPTTPAAQTTPPTTTPTTVPPPVTPPTVTPTTVTPTTVTPTPVTPTPGSGAGSGGAGPGSKAPGTTVPPSAPAAPGSPTALAGNDSATISWTAPATHGSAITGYTVKWTAGRGGSKSVPAGTTSVKITGLKNGTSYTFSVSATNTAGTGPAVQTAPVTPTTAIPSAPTTVTAQANKDGSITVTWTKATGQGHTIKSYTVTATPSSGTALAPVTVSSGTSTNLGSAQGIALGTSYTLTVTATNTSGGSSQPSSRSNPVTASTTPFAVTNLAATANGKGSVAVSWTCSTSCAAGSPLTKFTVGLTPQVGAPLTVTAVSGQTKYSTTVTGLASATNYTVSVTAYNKAWGAGQSATTAVLTEGQPTATVTPSWSGLSLTLSISVDANGATVTGCHVALNGPGGTLTASSSSGCTSLSMTAPYYAATYSGTLSITSTGFGTTNGANVSTTSGYKDLDATAQQLYTCTGTYCGRTSHSCPTSKWTNAKCTHYVAPGEQVEAKCWVNSTSNSGVTSKVSSTIWITVSPSFSTDPWMSSLWFDPYFTSAPSTLQKCP